MKKKMKNNINIALAKWLIIIKTHIIKLLKLKINKIKANENKYYNKTLKGYWSPLAHIKYCILYLLLFLENASN